jgi:hypothetical protein
MRTRPSRFALLGLLVAELLVYSTLVAGYLLLVLRFLSAWLKNLFDTDRTGYAVAALLLIVAQGMLLEWLTGAFLATLRRRTK